MLDAILDQAIEGRLGPSAIRRRRAPTARWSSRSCARLDRNEYKRRQAPLVLRTSTKAFGRGRRLPIVQRYGGKRP